MDWVAGLYVQRLEEDNDQLDLYGGEIFRALVSDYRADSVAVYGNGGWSAGERWRFALGVRAEQRRARYRDTDGSDLAPRETMFGGNATHDLSDSVARLQGGGLQHRHRRTGKSARVRCRTFAQHRDRHEVR
jgi:outer membrane receptor protein involved in Fe transport